MFEIVTTLFAIGLLVVIAFPKMFLPKLEPRKKRVGYSYWGVYAGQSSKQEPHAPTIETPKPARMRHPVAGSRMYAGGNGRK